MTEQLKTGRSGSSTLPTKVWLRCRAATFSASIGAFRRTIELARPTSRIEAFHTRMRARVSDGTILLTAVLGVLSSLLTVPAQDTNQLLNSWLAAQTNFQSWSADFVQTRTLKSLVEPSVARGHLSFAAPNRFRWEINHPAPTIAVRGASELLVIYPRLKRAERYPLTGNAAGQWRDTLALLEAGFPRNRADLESRFRIQSQTLTNQLCEVALQPRSVSARRMMPLLKIAFATNDFMLQATELQFADGSTMRNRFTNGVLNPKLDEALFSPVLPEDYKISEPTKTAR